MERFRKAGFGRWSLRHVFYAVMGGIMLNALDVKSFPINASQLCYLVETKYVNFSQDTLAVIEKESRERNRNNWFTRLINVLQVGWFLLQFVGRIFQGAALTTLELTTMAFVVCALPSFECWRKKPANIEIPGLFLVSNASIDTILHRAGESNPGQRYIRTPTVLWRLACPWYMGILAYDSQIGPRNRSWFRAYCSHGAWQSHHFQFVTDRVE